jgi:alkanesulfonate monooxygenase SsuD/methylene tetrahydromethanopterin reductase-like flavin-dependent oxidoreductase (luciferase family)
MQMRSGVFHTPFMKPERSARQTFEWAVECAIEADRAGFSDFMLGEHSTQAWESIPNPEMVIAACARETKTLRLAPMGHLPVLHEPGSLAIQIGWLSRSLEGRYFLGIGRGAYPNDFVIRGHAKWFASGKPDWTEARVRMDEAMKIMEGVWRREPFHYEGRYLKGGFPEQPDHQTEGFENAKIADHSPWGGPENLEIAITGLTMNSPSMQWAGENGWMPISFFGGSELLKSHWDTYAAAAEARGDKPDRSRYRVCREMFVADTDEEAKRRAINGGQGEAWRRYLLPIYKAYGIFDGYVTDSGTGIHPNDVDIDFLAEHVWLCGSPETVVRKIERMIELCGGEGWGTHCMVSHDYIDDPRPWFESMNRIAKEVVPNVNVPVSVG